MTVIKELPDLYRACDHLGLDLGQAFEPIQTHYGIEIETGPEQIDNLRRKVVSNILELAKNHQQATGEDTITHVIRKPGHGELSSWHILRIYPDCLVYESCNGKETHHATICPDEPESFDVAAPVISLLSRSPTLNRPAREHRGNTEAEYIERHRAIIAATGSLQDTFSDELQAGLKTRLDLSADPEAVQDIWNIHFDTVLNPVYGRNEHRITLSDVDRITKVDLVWLQIIPNQKYGTITLEIRRPGSLEHYYIEYDGDKNEREIKVIIQEAGLVRFEDILPEIFNVKQFLESEPVF